MFPLRHLPAPATLLIPLALLCAVLVGLGGCAPGTPAVETFGRGGLGDGEFVEPRGLAVCTEGLAVVDKSGRLQILRLDGTFDRGFRIAAPDVRRGFATGVTWLPDGRIALADTHKSRVTLYSGDGKPIAPIGEYGAEDGQFLYPQRVALRPDGTLVITEFGLDANNRVQEFNLDGKFLRTYGGTAQEHGALTRPMGVVVLPDGGVVVADQRAGLVRFAADGAFEGAFCAPETDPETDAPAMPYGLCRAPDGRLYATDLATHSVVRIDADGTPSGRFGGTGAEIGQFHEPWDIAWLDGYLYVADRGNHRIQRIDVERVTWR